MIRFKFLPGLFRVNLRPNIVRLGADPQRSVVLELPDIRFAALLEKLDNWLDVTGYRLAARALGLTYTDADAMLKLLRDNGLVCESVLPSRRRHRVFVNGTGALAHRVAATLRDSGLGRVWCADEGRRGKSTLAVLVDTAHPPTLAARGHARRRLPHLPVAVLDGSVHIGPMVVPGSTPCLGCVNLHYRDRSPNRPVRGGVGALEPPVVALAAGFIASVVLQRLDGEPCRAASSTILIGPSLAIGRREWTVHPECGCGEPVPG